MHGEVSESSELGLGAGLTVAGETVMEGPCLLATRCSQRVCGSLSSPSLPLLGSADAKDAAFLLWTEEGPFLLTSFKAPFLSCFCTWWPNGGQDETANILFIRLGSS